MQSRPPPPTKYHPPNQPQIPIQAVQSLIPRLSIAIRDIDVLRDQIAQGAQNGSIPNWDTLLQKYSMLLGRINTLSQYISLPPAPPKTSVPNVRPSAPETYPALSRYLVHPLNPLNSSGTSDPPLNPLAPDTFFQALNTQQLPSISESNAELLNQSPSFNHAASGSGSGSGTGQDRMSDLKKMDEKSLQNLEARLKDRLSRDSTRAKALVDEIRRKEDEVDWTMRIEDGDGDEDDEDDGDGDKPKEEERDDDDEDLFGDDDDEEGDDSMTGTKVVKQDQSGGGDGTSRKVPDPRAGWVLSDYLKYMDSGVVPQPPSG